MYRVIKGSEVSKIQSYRVMKDREVQSYERSGVTELNIKDPELQLSAEIQNCNVIKSHRVIKDSLFYNRIKYQVLPVGPP